MSAINEVFFIKEKSRIEKFVSAGQLDKARKAADRLSRKFRDNPEAWFIYGAVCGQQKDFRQAVICCKKTVQLAPQVAVAHFNLAIAEHQQGNTQQALQSLAKSVELDPRMTDAYREAGLILNSLEKHTEAIQQFKELHKLQPDDQMVLISLGNLYEKINNLVEAERSYREASKLKANPVAASINLANVLKAQGKVAEVESIYRELFEKLPGDIDVLYNYAVLHQSFYRYAQAESFYRKALEINPAHAASKNNLGVVLLAQNLFDESIDVFNEVLKSAPDNIDAMRNLSSVYKEQNKLELAEQQLDAALSIDKNNIAAHQDRSLIWLIRADFEKGWSEYEYRIVRSDEYTERWPYPEWNGDDISHKTILIYPEQGVGDEIMFSSCLADLSKVSGQIVLACDTRLVPLFKRSFPSIEVVARGKGDQLEWLDKLPAIDVQLSIGSLPAFFKRKAQLFTGCEFLKPDAGALKKWKERYNELAAGLNVGLSWRGGHISNTKLKRSVTLGQLECILKIPGVNYVNLQYGDCQAELEAIKQQTGVVINDWVDSNPLDNMDDFAAKIKALDLVISIDNSTVHLAGSLGVPTWIMQPFSSDWRWLLDTDNSYWYRSVRHFRQTLSGQWSDVIARVVNELENIKHK